MAEQETERETLERLDARLGELIDEVRRVARELFEAQGRLGLKTDPLTLEDRVAVNDAEEAITRGDYVTETWVEERLAELRPSRA